MTSAFRLGISFLMGDVAFEGAPKAEEGPSLNILSGVSAWIAKIAPFFFVTGMVVIVLWDVKRAYR
jgi:hypothetical protein